MSARWAISSGWHLQAVQIRNGVLEVAALGPPPLPDTDQLRRELADEGLAGLRLQVRLAVGGAQDYPARSSG